jgi:hypothetical protein
MRVEQTPPEMLTTKLMANTVAHSAQRSDGQTVNGLKLVLDRGLHPDGRSVGGER